MTEPSFTVHIQPDGTKARARQGDILSDVLMRAGVPLSAYCNKRGVCGKCAVRIVSGPLPFQTPREEALLLRRGLGPDHRLACLYEVRSDVAVEVLPGSRLESVAVLETGMATDVIPQPAVRKLFLSLERSGPASPEAALDGLRSLLKTRDLGVPLPVLEKLGGGSIASKGGFTAVLFGGREVLDIEPGDTTEGIFGLAVDLGTSTVVAEIADLRTGEVVGRASSVNTQASYGVDVVSRITFAFENPDNLRRLRRAVIQLLNELVAEAARPRGVPRHRIYEAVVAGNTAMNHFLCGVPVDTLAMAPFHAVFTALPPLPAAEIGLSINPHAKIHIVPNIGSFVGGDVTAGLAASEMASSHGRELFIDLGTNGEIVLKRGRELAAASTAAGPAFEGMNISCGMMAVAGAVHHAEWDDAGFRLRTIGDLPPSGVCGTGLVDILAIALENKLIRPDGRIAAPERRLELGSGLALTQQDVREIQLATAAIRTGALLMLREFRTPSRKLDRILVAGAFGGSLDVRNAVAIGLLPDIHAGRITFVGNASLAGARKLLLSAPEREAAEALAASIAHVSLASQPGFQDEFVKAMEFKPYRAGEP